MITADIEELKRARKELEGIDRAFEIVVARAVKSAARETKKSAVNRVIKEFYIDKKPVNDSIKIKSPTTENPLAEISNNREKDTFTLKRFKVEVPANGPIKVAQSRSGGLKELKRGFIAAPKNQPGNIQVFRRKSKKRYPIEVQRGYSTGGMLNTTDISDYLEEVAQEKIYNQIDKEVVKFFDEKEV